MSGLDTDIISAKVFFLPSRYRTSDFALPLLLGQHGERNLAAVQRRFAYHFDRFLARLSA